MSDIKGLQRLFGGCGLLGNGGLIIILVLAAVLFMGEELIEWIFCDDMAIIWIVLLVLLLTSFDDGCGC